MKKVLVLISMFVFIFFSNNLDAKSFNLGKDKIEVSGDTIGLELNLGVTIIGTYGINIDGKNHFPWKEAGLNKGDIIKYFNDSEINDSKDLSKQLLLAKDKETTIKVLRDNKLHTKKITAVKKNDGTYSLGLYIKDKLLGIGTMTYIYEDIFSSLGHSIKSNSFNGGVIKNAKVTKLIKGEKNQVGEKHATMMEKEIGIITKNTKTGVHGIISDKSGLNLNSYSVKTQNDVKLGKATILTCLDGKKVEEFEIEIVEKYKQNTSDIKSMKIKVTDPYLLEKTGGIIQGMSGSPIIQDGFIIGAVTHVMVNDPTSGYGIYIEWMLEDMEISIE